MHRVAMGRRLLDERPRRRGTSRGSGVDARTRPRSGRRRAAPDRGSRPGGRAVSTRVTETVEQVGDAAAQRGDDAVPTGANAAACGVVGEQEQRRAGGDRNARGVDVVGERRRSEHDHDVALGKLLWRARPMGREEAGERRVVLREAAPARQGAHPHRAPMRSASATATSTRLSRSTPAPTTIAGTPAARSRGSDLGDRAPRDGVTDEVAARPRGPKTATASASQSSSGIDTNVGPAWRLHRECGTRWRSRRGRRRRVPARQLHFTYGLRQLGGLLGEEERLRSGASPGSAGPR